MYRPRCFLVQDVAYAEPSDNNNWHNIIHDMYSHKMKWPSNFGPPESWKSAIPQRVGERMVLGVHKGGVPHAAGTAPTS